MNDQDETQRDSTGHVEPLVETAQQRVECDVGSGIVGGIPYELRIGVTGHRNLDNRKEVKAAVHQLIIQLFDTLSSASRDPHGRHGSPRSWVKLIDRALTCSLGFCSRLVCPIVNSCLRRWTDQERWLWPVVPISPAKPTEHQQTPLKLTGISCLAAGADQILIEVIRDLLSDQPRAGLVTAAQRNRYVEAVLPFAQEEYEKDFSSQELTRFRDLVQLDRGRFQQAAQPTVVYPKFPGDGHGGTLHRDDAYAAAGRYMVDTSEIVVAIWNPRQDDETDDPKTGGTSETARYAINRGKLVVWLNPDELENGPSVLRPAGTHSNGQQGKSVEWKQRTIVPPPELVALELPTRGKYLSPNFHQLAAYNRDAAIRESELDEAVKGEAADFEDRARGNLPPPVRQTIVKHILPHMVRADRLSRRYRDLRGVAAWLWPTTAAFAVTMIGFQIFFLPSDYWIAWFELSLLVICAASYRVSLSDAWHEKWLNDRRLAEGLRTVLYSSLVTTSDPDDDSQPRSSADQSSSKVQNPLPFYSAQQSWLIGTIKRIVRRERRRFTLEMDLNKKEDLQGVKQFLAEDWIERQISYHLENETRREAKTTKYERLHLLVMASIVIVSILHALGVGHLHTEGDHAGSHFGRIDIWIALFTSALPAWGAAVYALSTSEDHERLANRSGRMARLLRGVATQITKASSPEILQGAVDDAEALFDLENQEWAESLADRKPVAGG